MRVSHFRAHAILSLNRRTSHLSLLLLSLRCAVSRAVSLTRRHYFDAALLLRGPDHQPVVRVIDGFIQFPRRTAVLAWVLAYCITYLLTTCISRIVQMSIAKVGTPAATCAASSCRSNFIQIWRGYVRVLCRAACRVAVFGVLLAGHTLRRVMHVRMCVSLCRLSLAKLHLN